MAIITERLRMTSEEFVAVIKRIVFRGAISDVLKNLQDPPGREPELNDVVLAQWFHKLPSDQRQLVSRVVELAAYQATYNFLLILDGLAAIERVGEKGKLEVI